MFSITEAQKYITRRYQSLILAVQSLGPSQIALIVFADDEVAVKYGPNAAMSS